MSFRINHTKSKTLTSAMIARNNKTEDTKPEVCFDALSIHYGFFCRKPRQEEHYPFLTADRETHSFTPDRVVSFPNGVHFLIEIDGKYHQKGVRYAGEKTVQEKKSIWRDKMLNQQGQRILHIEAQLLTETEPKLKDLYWSWVWKKLAAFAMSDKKSDYVRA